MGKCHEAVRTRENSRLSPGDTRGGCQGEEVHIAGSPQGTVVTGSRLRSVGLSHEGATALG